MSEKLLITKINFVFIMKNKRVEMSELEKLKDEEKIATPEKAKRSPIFNFMFKKQKIKKIKFQLNSKKRWIFPLSSKSRDYRYKFTEPNVKFLKLIKKEKAKEILDQLNSISQNYFDNRFR